MSAQPVFVYLGGEIISNNQTLGAVDEHTLTVPLGRKWKLIMARIERDVNATLDTEMLDTDGATILTNFTQIAAGVSHVKMPMGLAAQEQRMWDSIILGGGQSIHIEWGVAQATPVVVFQVLEF